MLHCMGGDYFLGGKCAYHDLHHLQVALWFPKLKGAVPVTTSRHLPVIGFDLILAAGKVYNPSLDLHQCFGVLPVSLLPAC